MSNTNSLSSNDLRKTLPRFQENTLKKNLKLVSAINSFVQKKDMTNAQLALAWLLKKAPHIVPIPGTKRIKYLIENRAAIDKILTDDDMQEIEAILAQFPVFGGRYSENFSKLYNLEN